MKFLKLLGNISAIQSPQAILASLILLSALIPIWIMFKGTQIVTGDEPRYLFYTSSLWERHISLHSIIYPAIMSGAVGKIGVLGGRLVTLILGLGGLAGVFLCLRHISDTNAQAFGFSLLTAITLPTLPYLSLALPEVVLFSGTAWSLYFLENQILNLQSLLHCYWW